MSVQTSRARVGGRAAGFVFASIPQLIVFAGYALLHSGVNFWRGESLSVWGATRLRTAFTLHAVNS